MKFKNVRLELKSSLPIFAKIFAFAKKVSKYCFSEPDILNYSVMFPYNGIAEYKSTLLPPIKDNQVLVKSYFTVISQGTELAAFNGLPNANVPYPFNPGYTGSGVILKIGKSVKNFEVGDKIAGKLSHSRFNLLNDSEIYKISDSNMLLQSSFIFLCVICMQAVRKSDIKPGDYVAVIGQGLLGQITNMLVKSFAPSSLIGVAKTNTRKEFSKNISGVSKFVSTEDSSHNDFKNKCDIVIDSTGSSKALSNAIDFCKPEGKIVLLGSNRDLFTIKNKHLSDSFYTIIGAHISTIDRINNPRILNSFRSESKLILRMIEKGQIDIKPIITQIANPKECNEVYRNLNKPNKFISTLFQWRDDS